MEIFTKCIIKQKYYKVAIKITLSYFRGVLLVVRPLIIPIQDDFGKF